MLDKLDEIVLSDSDTPMCDESVIDYWIKILNTKSEKLDLELLESIYNFINTEIGKFRTMVLEPRDSDDF